MAFWDFDKYYYNDIDQEAGDSFREFSEDNILNSNWVQKYSSRSDLDVRYINKLLGILALEIWYRLFITKDLDPNEKLTI